MKEEQVNTIVYITDDGKRFDNLELAQEHENHIKEHMKALETLKTFKIEGPNYTPIDGYELPAHIYNWQWYKVHDRHELEHVLRLAAEVYTMKKCSDDDDFDKVEVQFYNEFYMAYDLLYDSSIIEQKRKFPKYIAISFDYNSITTLDIIEKRHEMEMKKYEKFYQFFKNDLKK